MARGWVVVDRLIAESRTSPRDCLMIAVTWRHHLLAGPGLVANAVGGVGPLAWVKLRAMGLLVAMGLRMLLTPRRLAVLEDIVLVGLVLVGVSEGFPATYVFPHIQDMSALSTIGARGGASRGHVLPSFPTIAVSWSVGRVSAHYLRLNEDTFGRCHTGYGWFLPWIGEGHVI
jgi:hypothetical protein